MANGRSSRTLVVKADELRPQTAITTYRKKTQLLTRQKAKAYHCRILPCIIMAMLVNSTKVSNVKDPKRRVSFGKDHRMLQGIPDRYPAKVCRSINFNSRIAAWNVRPMHQSGKMDNIRMEIKRMKISILVVCEVRWTQPGKLTSEGTTFIYQEEWRTSKALEYFLMRYCKICLVSGVFQTGLRW